MVEEELCRAGYHEVRGGGGVPTILAVGTDAQKEEFVRPALSDDVHFALGYTEPDGTKYEVVGDWAWGHQMDLIASGQGFGTGLFNQSATISYTFPIPAGNTVGITAYMTDGDFCGDFVTGTWTYYNVGQSSAGQQVAGNVHLEQ